MKQRHKQRGSLLVVALFIIIVVVAFVTVLSRILSTSAHTNIVEYYGSLAFLTAQSGIEWKLNQIFHPDTNTNTNTNTNTYPLTVYKIVKGDTEWPHGGGLWVKNVGSIVVRERNGVSDDKFDDYSDNWGNPEESYDGDELVIKSSVEPVGAFQVGDFVDSRYSYQITPVSNLDFPAEIYFLAKNQSYVYGKYFVSNEPLKEVEVEEGAVYYFDGYNPDGTVRYDELHYSNDDCLIDVPDKPEFIQNMRYMSDCSVEVSCKVIQIDQNNDSTNPNFQSFYRISSTAKCESGRFSTERTIHIDAKTL